MGGGGSLGSRVRREDGRTAVLGNKRFKRRGETDAREVYVSQKEAKKAFCGRKVGKASWKREHTFLTEKGTWGGANAAGEETAGGKKKIQGERPTLYARMGQGGEPLGNGGQETSKQRGPTAQGENGTNCLLARKKK